MVCIYKIRGKICSFKILINMFIDCYGFIIFVIYVGKSCKVYKVNLLRKFFIGKIMCIFFLVYIKIIVD